MAPTGAISFFKNQVPRIQPKIVAPTFVMLILFNSSATNPAKTCGTDICNVICINEVPQIWPDIVAPTFPMLFFKTQVPQIRLEIVAPTRAMYKNKNRVPQFRL